MNKTHFYLSFFIFKIIEYERKIQMHHKISKVFDRLFVDIKSGTEEEKTLYKGIITKVLANEDVIKLFNIKHHKNTNRLVHCLHVSYRCFLVSYRHQMDYVSAAIGGLLHDFCLTCKGEYTRKTYEDIWCFYHPQIALKNTEKYFAITDITRDMIIKHMFPITLSIPKYKETYLIAYWDKYYAIRELCTIKKHTI